MNIIENMVQGSGAWHQLRQQRFTASEAAAVFGDHKYMTRNDLLKQKKTGITPEVSEHQQRIFDNGHKFEAAARSIAEKITGEELYPCTCEDDTGTYLASMDGLDMLATFGWEHKTMNESLRTATAETLDEHYKWQMDHQMMVTGCERILFMASTGTEDDCVSFWYERDEDRIQRLLAGWEQFKADLDAYEPQPEKVTATGTAPDSLPALVVELSGAVRASNLAEFKDIALARIASIKTELVTDEDFATAEKTIKFLDKAEKELENTKAAALQQTASIDELFKTIDHLKAEMRDKRLLLNRTVKAEKENRKAQIVEQADKAFTAWLNQQASPAPVNVHFAPAIAMKGKKTIASLQSAADDALAAAKVEAKQQIDLFKSNLAILEAKGKEHRFLFSDWKQLIAKQPEDLESTITARIAEHEQREQAKLEAERERIRREEEAKAKAEAERLQREEQQRIQQERDQELVERQKAEQTAAAEADLERANSAPVEQPRQQVAADTRSREEIDIACWLFDNARVTQAQAGQIAQAIVNRSVPHVEVRTVKAA
jgi:putative phage-type endonuclease